MTQGCPIVKCNDAESAAFDQTRASVEEAYRAYEELRARGPVVESESLGSYYLLLNHRDVRKAATDFRTFSSGEGVGLPRDRHAPRLPALEQDPPEHGPMRKLYTDAIAPASLRAIEPEVAAIADRLIDSFASKGECDLVRDFCQPLPVLGISAVLGLTGAEPQTILRLAFDLTEASSDREAFAPAMMRLGAFILGEVHARRSDPKDDYLTQIALAEIDGKLLDDETMTRFMVGFLVAGHETTSAALAGLLSHILPRPELRQRLLDDDNALAAAIEEAVRITSPFHGFSRVTTAPVEVSGCPIPADATVRLSWAAANRDPTVFEAPAEFNIDRPSNPHLGFGIGRHSCAGAPFARLEMRVAVRRLLHRLPDIGLVGDKTEWHFSGGIMTLPDSVRVHFSPR